MAPEHDLNTSIFRLTVTERANGLPLGFLGLSVKQRRQPKTLNPASPGIGSDVTAADRMSHTHMFCSPLLYLLFFFFPPSSLALSSFSLNIFSVVVVVWFVLGRNSGRSPKGVSWPPFPSCHHDAKKRKSDCFILLVVFFSVVLLWRWFESVVYGTKREMEKEKEEEERECKGTMDRFVLSVSRSRRHNLFIYCNDRRGGGKRKRTQRKENDPSTSSTE